MRPITTLLRQSSLALIRVVRAVRRQTVELFGGPGADTGRYFAQAKADLTKLFSKLHSKLRSLVSKVAANKAASSS
ncbi:hypothetical protein ACVWY3_000353 [Bradyrhizobium sp. USDA 4486]